MISPQKPVIIHVTPWYISGKAPLNGVWIKRHIDLLSENFESRIIHIDLQEGAFSKRIQGSNNLKHVHIQLPSLLPWRMREWYFHRALVHELKAQNAHQAYAVIFHIAYPALVHVRFLKKHLPQRVGIMEHWSAYRFSFHSSKRNRRIRNMLNAGWPIAAVSNALHADIEHFTERTFPKNIIPNTVDEMVFHPKGIQVEDHVLAVAFWAPPKNPIELLQCYAKSDRKAELPLCRIGGMGPLVESMQEFVKHHQLEDKISFLGLLSEQQIADELNRAKACIIPSEYETFSVIAAEAAMCGCPVIAKRVGGIPEVVEEENVIWVEHGDWEQALLHIPTMKPENREIYAEKARVKFGKQQVRELWLNFIASL